MNATLLLILAILIAFGLIFDRLVGRIEADDPDHGYTAIWVVVGVGVTVALISPIIGWMNALIVIAGFIASGVPMILGSIRRHLESRRRDRQAQAADLQRATHAD